MSFLDDLGKKAAKLTEQTLDKSQELATITKLKLKLKNLKTDLDDIYCEVGKQYLESLGDTISPNEEISNLRMSVYELEEEMKAIEQKIEDYK